MYKLVVIEGDVAGLEFPVSGDEISLGRRSDNDVCLPTDMKLSRHHARIARRGDEWLLIDQASANGTFLGNRRIYAPSPLSPGDRFRIGTTWLQFIQQEDEGAEMEAAEQVVLVGAGERTGAAEAGPEASAQIIFALDAANPQAGTDEADIRNRLAILLDFGQALGSILEVPRLLRVALDRIMNAIPAEQASLLLVDPQTGQITPKVVRSRAARSDGSALAETKLRISEHIVRQALDQRMAILTSDATADARFVDADSVHSLQIRSAICAPMIAHTEPIGVIYLDTSSRTNILSENDVHLVSGIASQTAMALENARLYTDLRQAYEELQAAQDQLVRSERVATVGVLSASIAHDMANIVSPLKPLIDMLLSGRYVDDEARGVLTRQVERLLALVERLLAFSRTGGAQLTPTDLNEVVEHTLTLVRTELVHRRIEIQLSLHEPLPTVSANAAQLERALLNLLLNAADAMEPSSVRKVVIKTEVEDDSVSLSVTDTGPGIPDEVQQKMFEPFFTTKESGTGLGLFSCRRIVEEEHKGMLELDSRPGEGTTITMRLPQAAVL